MRVRACVCVRECVSVCVCVCVCVCVSVYACVSKGVADPVLCSWLLVTVFILFYSIALMSFLKTLRDTTSAHTLKEQSPETVCDTVHCTGSNPAPSRRSFVTL